MEILLVNDVSLLSKVTKTNPLDVFGINAIYQEFDEVSFEEKHEVDPKTIGVKLIEQYENELSKIIASSAVFELEEVDENGKKIIKVKTKLAGSTLAMNQRKGLENKILSLIEKNNNLELLYVQVLAEKDTLKHKLNNIGFLECLKNKIFSKKH